MAGESQQTPKSEPDPSVLTTEQLERGLKAERDYVKGQVKVLKQRLSGMDRATALLSDTVNRVPTAMQVAITNEREVFDEKLKTARLEIKATKESAAERAISSTLAINKAEVATAEALKKQEILFERTTGDQQRQINELKERLTASESVRKGGTEARMALYALGGFIASLVIMGSIILAAWPRR